MLNRLGRYRFTLAHELCHMLLHREIYDNAKIHSLDDYVRFQEELDPDLRAAYEFQAMNLAGRLLLPKGAFVKACARVLAPLRKRIPTGADLSLLCELVAARTGPQFEVSEEVAFRRLFKDGLYKNLELGSEYSR
jgi:Zn-dependent peptidase ImmA (M78 family)